MTRLEPKRPRKSQNIPARLQAHIDALGIVTVAGYKRWCYENGLSTRVDKSAITFETELALARDLKELAGPPPSWRHRPERAAQITRIYKNRDEGSGFLNLYARAFDRLSDNHEARHALYRLFMHMEKYADLFGRLGGIRRHRISTFVLLARRHHEWIRPIETWFPKSEGKETMHGDMVRHLFARYALPRFFDRVWRQNPADPDTQRHQAWYRHVGNGGNIRTAEGFSAHLTKRMAHLFLKAPSHSRIEHAVRWAQVKALGGDSALARAVIKTRLGEVMENEDFWFTVIQFLVNNPMLDPEQAGPIVDYIYHRKYVPREIIQPGGGVIEGPPPHPNFCVKARSADKLVRLVEEWHGDLAAEDFVALKEWKPAAYRPFEHTDTDAQGRERTWTIHELCTSWELALEGKALHHCVRSYANRCVKGTVSIWSTQVRVGEEGAQPVLTVAVDNVKGRITQYRGKFNMQPNTGVPSRRKDISTTYVELLNGSSRILRLWADREQLRTK